MVLDQIVQCGTIELVKIMHDGYPNRCMFEEITTRFRDLLPEIFQRYGMRTDHRLGGRLVGQRGSRNMSASWQIATMGSTLPKAVKATVKELHRSKQFQVRLA